MGFVGFTVGASTMSLPSLCKPNGFHSEGSDIRLMDRILHDPKDPKLWELWYIPYYGSCRILSINRSASNPSPTNPNP